MADLSNRALRMGIMGAGGIAEKMAITVNRMSEAVCYAVASRDMEKAESFREKYGFERAYGSYEEMLEDDKVDLVYIAIPHSYHCEWTKKSIMAGRAVLCEKAFAFNEKEGREMIDLAREKNILLAEAIWTRYMPSRKMINDIIESGIIGEVKTISANLGYKVNHRERIVRPELAGGALLDLTVYPINFCSMIMGNNIKRITASCVMMDTGVDGQDNVMFEYENGAMASMFTTVYALTNRQGMIAGTKGFIEVQNINNPEYIRVYDSDRNGPKLIQETEMPAQITGYEYEVLACKSALERGAIECLEMPHSEILEIMRQMDAIKEKFGEQFFQI